MNSTQERATVKHHSFPRLRSITSQDEENHWKEYLMNLHGITGLKPVHEQMLEFTRYFKKQELEGRKLFHLSVTYKPYDESRYDKKNYKDNSPYGAKKTNEYFINFYTKNFLPFLMNTRNYNSPPKRMIQPICYSFLDEHEMKRVFINGVPSFRLKLHHHAIVAVHPETYQRMCDLEGENAIPIRSRFASKVMTTFVRECEPMTVLYACKMMQRYPDFLSFPDRLH